MKNNPTRRLFYIALACFASLKILCQTQVQEISPLSGSLLIVRFNEGSINYHKAGQLQFGSDRVVYQNSPLNVGLASILSTYTLSSPDDPNYATPRSPLRINRKSKPNNIAINDPNGPDPTHTNEHFIYLTLPTALSSGKSYTLSIAGGIALQPTYGFVFDERSSESEAIHINNLGYSPASPAKFAYLYHWAGDAGSVDLSAFNGQPFNLVEAASGATAFTGSIAFRRSKTNQESTPGGIFVGETPNDNWLGADVWECDFSAFSTSGQYRLVVPGMGSSAVFSIDNDVYRKAFSFTMKGLLQNRSGINLSTSNGAGRDRPAPHNVNITPGFAGRLKYTADPNAHGCGSALLGNINTYGWYQDAGDWDEYPNHSAVPLLMMFLYEASPGSFADRELGNPESGNGLPDVLDEGAWLLRYYQRTRQAILAARYGTGGVGGGNVAGDECQTGDLENGLGRPSWQDVNRDWIVSGEDVNLTFLYSGMAAQMAFILQSLGQGDPEGIDWQREALESWQWASSRTLSTVPRMYAAASLYRLTGEEKYHTQFKKDFKANVNNTTNLSLDGDAPTAKRWAVWTYLLTQYLRPLDEATLETARQAVFFTTDFLTNFADKRACRWAGDPGFPYLAGQPSTPKIEDIVYAVVAATNKGDISAANTYKKYIFTTADYFLGTNPLRLSWITGVTEKAPKQLFHFDSWYSGDGSIKDGYVPYGGWSRFQNFGNNAFSSGYPYNFIYPTDIAQWPGHERWFDHRSSPLSAEFTVNQTNAVAAFVYGFLSENKFTPQTPVSGLAISPSLLTFSVFGESQNLTASVFPTDASNKGVFWFSRNTNVASVDGTGKVTALAQGNTYIVGVTFDGTKIDSALVISNLPFIAPESVSISSPATTVNRNRTLQLTATVLPESATIKTVSWASSNSAVASIDSEGLLSGITPGEVTITATTQDGTRSATLALRVLDPPASIIADYETSIPTINIVLEGRVQQFGSGAIAIIPNPVSSTENNSPHVASFQKGEGTFKLTGFVLPVPVQIADGYRQLEFQLYGTSLSRVYVQASSSSGKSQIDQFVDLTAGSWQSIKLPLPDSSDVKQVNIFPNPFDNNAGTFYIDNVQVTSGSPAVALNGLKASYFNNTDLSGNPVLVRTDAAIAFDWGQGSPAEGIVNNDRFSVRWEGQLLTPVTESYTFSTYSDDGVRVFLNGQLIIDNFTDHAPTVDESSTISLVGGQKYSLKVEYYENGGGALNFLSWQYTGQSAVVIPEAYYFQPTGANARTAVEAKKSKTSAKEASAEGDKPFTLYPNPATGQVNVVYHSDLKERVDIGLINSLGVEIAHFTQQANEGNNTLTLPLHVKPGIYYLIILKQGNAKQARRLIVE